jgi:hypothetical protein
MNPNSNSHAGSTSAGAQALPNYYSLPAQAPGLEKKFLNIDDLQNYTDLSKKLQDAGTKNFVTDIWSDSAWCAVDVDTNEIKALLQANRPSRLDEDRWIETRWINIWGGDLQADAVSAVAAHYGLSPRLKGLMCAAAIQSGPPNNEGSHDGSQQDSDSSRVSNEKVQDVEAIFDASAGTKTARQALKDMDFKEIKFGHIVNEIWHWHTVDWGQRYLCLGYNSLFTVPGVKLDNGLNRPEGKRIWCWLVLCDDGTVISIYENPFPQMAPNEKILRTVRRNVLNVFYHLSTVCNTAGNLNSLMTVQIRNFDQPNQPVEGSSSMEVASKLLYYLFDDWITSYGLVAKKEHPYGTELEGLRGGMLNVAKVDLVDSLHRIGRRLAVLKRVYQSYEQMITRILQRQRLLRDDAHKEGKVQAESRPVTTSGEHYDNGHRPSMFRSTTVLLTTSEDMSLGVPLSSSAIVRFERLLDRIKLYAISEIDECLNEKESLVFMVGFVTHATYSRLLTFLEFQSDSTERGSSSGKAHKDYYPPCKSNDNVPASQSDDRILFRSNSRSYWSLHLQDLLAMLSRDCRLNIRILGHIWSR